MCQWLRRNKSHSNRHTGGTVKERAYQSVILFLTLCRTWLQALGTDATFTGHRSQWEIHSDEITWRRYGPVPVNFLCFSVNTAKIDLGNAVPSMWEKHPGGYDCVYMKVYKSLLSHFWSKTHTSALVSISCLKSHAHQTPVTLCVHSLDLNTCQPSQQTLWRQRNNLKTNINIYHNYLQ